MRWVDALMRATVEAGTAAVVTREVRRYYPRVVDDEMLRIMANAIWIRMNAGG